MNIEEKIFEISKSLNEKKFNMLINYLSRAKLITKKYICETIFKKIDSELTLTTQNENFLRTLIAVPIELAIREELEQKQNPQNNNELIECVSSHLLARSNVPNQSFRIALSVFYSHISNQPIWKKQKILERFGENILISMFEIYSLKEKKSNLALSFLLENFESFLSLSPEIASMTNNLLKKLMLQKTELFVCFIDEYKNFLQKKEDSAEFFIAHMSFLVQYIFELNHEALMGYVLKTLIDYINNYKHNEMRTKKNFQILIKILLQSKSQTAQTIGSHIQSTLANNQKISCATLFKSIDVKNTPWIFTKKKKSLNKLSPFQKIAFLHNDN